MDVFFVNSPLQLLNAIEARHQIPGLNPHPLLIRHPGLRSLEGMRELTGLLPWGEVVDLGGGAGPFARWRDLRRLERATGGGGHWAVLFLGDSRMEMMRHLAHVAPFERIVLLDDGLGTIAGGASGQRDEGVRSASDVAKEWLKGAILRQFAGSLPIAERFSAYAQEGAVGGKVIRNEYAFLRSRVSFAGYSNEVLFLGSPLIQAGLLTDEAYATYMRGVRRFFAEEKVTYVAHRREDPVCLEWMRGELGFDVQSSPRIIEWELANRRWLPRVLAGFNSAGLLNCHLIFGGAIDIHCFRLRAEHMHVRFREESAIIYDYFERYFDIIEVPPAV